jgi:DNA-binding SARP family transcriptional activator
MAYQHLAAAATNLSGEGASVEIKVLGPLVARHNGLSVAPIARKPRQVFTLLTLQAGSMATVPALMEELWAANPPASALTTLQTYILQVRRGIAAALGSSSNDAAKEILRTSYGGYQLAIDRDDVDVFAYERLAAAGKNAYERGEFEVASNLLRRALDVWRGDALVDVSAGIRLGMEVARLEESRLGVLELCIDAELRMGRHAHLLVELSALTARYPMHENLCSRFMVALHRSGRKSQALEIYLRLRRTLVNELGIEPSARVQQLQQAILRSDPELDTARPELAVTAR